VRTLAGTLIQVRFAVPQQHLAALRTSLAGEALPVRVSARGDATQAAQGQLTFLENSVDTATGTLSLKATFPNLDLQLWPGASVDVVLTLGTERNALVVPAEAVRESQDGRYVFVVGPDGKVKQQPVQVARTTERLALLREGVSPQDQVVTDGFVRLRDGAQVAIQRAAPQASTQPSSQAQLGEPVPALGAVR
jgi:membrane fusion protein, multidrug efflux system